MAGSRALWEEIHGNSTDGKVVVGRTGEVAPNMSRGVAEGKEAARTRVSEYAKQVNKDEDAAMERRYQASKEAIKNNRRKSFLGTILGA